jgi:dihydropyrimidine dehydrogenase (NAD+) subunit PreA
MHYGFRLVEQLISGLEGWMQEKGFAKMSDLVGRSVPRIKPWGELDLNYKIVAEIDPRKCIHCGLCYIACEDGAHQSIRWDRVPTAEYLRNNGQAQVVRSGGVEVLPGAGGETINVFTIKQDSCVGCNLCSLVCPVEGCITMKDVNTGKPPMTWNQYQALLAVGKVETIQPPEHV